MAFIKVVILAVVALMVETLIVGTVVAHDKSVLFVGTVVVSPKGADILESLQFYVQFKRHFCSSLHRGIVKAVLNVCGCFSIDHQRATRSCSCSIRSRCDAISDHCGLHNGVRGRSVNSLKTVCSAEYGCSI